MSRVALRCLALLAFAGIIIAPVKAQVLAPGFASSYSLVDLGSAPSVPGSYGGITLKNGDSNTLLLGGAANGSSGAVHQVSLVRSTINGKERITGFTGTSPVLSTAPNIDGGLLYAPNGTLMYTGYSNNILAQIKPGSATPDKTINLSPLGISSSVGAMQIIPAGFGGNSGKLLIASYNSSDYYTADLVDDGAGTYNLANVSTSLVNLGGGPEGIIYVPAGSPLFTAPTMLVSEYSVGRVSAYDVDALGLPIVATRRDFVTGLSGAEGATIDATTGDLLFSTFGSGNRVISVRGFATVVPEAGTGLLVALPALGTVVAMVVRRRRLV